MNWKLIFQLSLFGLAMAIATVFVIPSNIEPLFWLVIFLACAYLISRNARRLYFLHGFLVSLVNGVWVTGAHVLLFDQYVARHADEIGMMERLNAPVSQRVLMILLGIAAGIISGLVLGLFSFIAAKLFAKGAKGKKKA